MGGADLKFDSVATCGRSSSFLSGVKFWVATSDHIIDGRLESAGVASPESALDSIQPFPGRNRQNTPLFTL